MFGRSTSRSWLRAALPLAALVVSAAGCVQTPRIDPSGQRLFTYDSPYIQKPGRYGPHDRTAVMVTPAKIIAPVGSEVVVQAAVCGQDQKLMASEPVEWSIAPSSVGHFVQAGEATKYEWFRHI